jgi:hypothetical protein
MQSSPYSNQPQIMTPPLRPGDPGPLFLEPVSNPWAVASLICGIGVVVVPIISGVLAIIFGHLGLSEIHRQPAKYKGTGFAVAGLILGYLQLIAIVAIVLIFGLIVGATALHFGG